MDVTPDDVAIEELLGAYALDACDPEEAAAVEALLARRPDLAREVARLADAAVWVGATEALEAPATLRESVLEKVRARQALEGLDPALRAYVASTTRLQESFDALEPDEHELPTENGLNAHDLVVHLAAQESLFAQAIGASPVPEIEDTDVATRTEALVRHLSDQSIDGARDIWQRSVDAVQAWASDPATRSAMLQWLSFDMPRDNLLVARAFENWIHRDDFRVATGRAAEAPPARELQEMANMSVGSLPLALAATGHARPGKTARVVLTGPGGGDWTFAMGGVDGQPAGAPDVTLTADVVDWCRVAGERLGASELERAVVGDASLVDDLLAAAPAFATL